MNCRFILILSTIVLVYSRFLKELPKLAPPDAVLDFKLSNLSPIESDAPFSQIVHVSFLAFGQKWQSQLTVSNDIVSPDATIISYGENGKLLPHKKFHSRIYQSDPKEMPFISATLYDTDKISATIFTKYDIYHISPIEQYPDQSMVAAMDKSKMVMYKEDTDSDAFEGTSPGRSLLQGYTPFRTPCYAGEDTPRKISVGIVADAGFVLKTSPNTDATITEYFRKANLIFNGQLNITLELTGGSIIKNSGQAFDKIPTIQDPENPTRGLCANSSGQIMLPGEQLALFKAWKTQVHAKDKGTWHLLTDCQPPPGTVGLSFIRALCLPDASVGFTSFTGTETWRTFTHEIGHNFGATHSFERGRGTTGGIMDYGNGYYPYFAGSPQDIPAGSNTKIQFNVQQRRADVCGYVNKVILDTDGEIAADQSCFTAVSTTYQWFQVTCASGVLEAGCTCGCNNNGNGSWTGPVHCKEGNTKVDDSLCPIPKPFGIQTSCDYPGETDGLTCPQQLNGTSCNHNDIKNIGEECDNSNGCCSNCVKVKSDACRASDATRDAAFNYVKNSTQNFIFQGEAYARYTDRLTQQVDMVSPAYPRPIKPFWRNLDEDWTRGIDAIIQRKEGRAYMFKGARVTEYEVGFGQHNDYPKLIANSMFSTVRFSLGPPTTVAPIEAALSMASGAYLFQGNEYVKYDYGQTSQDPSYPRSISDFDLGSIHFKNGVSACIHYWDDDAVDFFSADGFRQRWMFGLGKQGAAISVPGLDVTDANLAIQLSCVNDCLECDADVGGTCIECDSDFVLVSGLCYPRNFMIEVEFDNYRSDIKFIKKSSFERTDWGKTPGITGSGMEFLASGSSYLALKPPNTPVKDFEFHFWIKLKDIRPTTLLVAKVKAGSKEINVQVICSKITEDFYSVAFSFGGTYVESGEKLMKNEFDHLIFTFRDGEVRTTVNGDTVALPYFDYDPDQMMYMTDVQVGDANGNGWYGLLDQFHVDNLNIPATEKYLADIGSSSHISSSLLLVPLLFLVTFFV